MIHQGSRDCGAYAVATCLPMCSATAQSLAAIFPDKASRSASCDWVQAWEQREHLQHAGNREGGAIHSAAQCGKASDIEQNGREGA